MIGIDISINSSVPLDSYTPILEDFAKPQTAWFIPALLWSDYSGSSIRIRRASDDAETDIGFSDGLLDEDAISTHCGASEGFIVTAYDQSGNSNDWTQATTTLQPKIYDGSAVIKGGGFAAMWSDDTTGSHDSLSVTMTGVATSTSFDVISTDRDFTTLTRNGSPGGYYGVMENGSASAPASFAGSPDIYVNGSIVSFTRDAFHDAVINTDSIIAFVSLDLSASSWTIFYSEFVSNDTYKPATYQHGKIIYDTDQSANRAAIETALNDFLGFY